MELSNRTLGQWLEHWAGTTPDKEYIVYSDRNLRFTWSQYNERVDNMASGLLAIGVERGTHVGIWAGNVPDWLTFLYACAKIGAVAVTVNTNYKQAELEYLCKDSDMHTLCIVNGDRGSDDYVNMVYTMLPELRTYQRGYLKSEKFPDHLHAKLNVMLRDISSLINHTNFSFERLEYLQNTVIAIINLDQNKIMKVFTLVSLMLMPPTLIASFFGMNVSFGWVGTSAWSWLIVLLLMGISTVAIFMVFKRRKMF